MFNGLAKLVTLLLLIGLYLERRSHVTPAAATEYHQRVDQAVQSVPASFRGWEGAEVPVPEPAQRLLRPNSVLARKYSNRDVRLGGELVVIHCRDVRDLQGHYPPACYPPHGWVASGPTEDLSMSIEGLTIPLRRYEFQRDTFAEQSRTVIYGFFAMPQRGLVVDMDAVREGAADYRMRIFGAAQIQVIFTGGMLRSEEESVVRELLTPVVPVVRTIRAPSAGGRDS